MLRTQEKDTFMNKLRKVCQLILLPECLIVDNNKLFCAMFDAIQEVHPSSAEYSTKLFQYDDKLCVY